jgi:hypothetical protein
MRRVTEARSHRSSRIPRRFLGPGTSRREAGRQPCLDALVARYTAGLVERGGRIQAPLFSPP